MSTLTEISDPDVFRKKMREEFAHVIEKHASVKLNEEQLTQYSTNIEIGVYNYTIKEASHKKIVKKWDNHLFVRLYIDRLRGIYINIKNPALLNQLCSGEIQAQAIAFMTHQEFNPDRWRDLIEKKRVRDASKLNNKVEASTDLYTCPIRTCRSKKCTYYEMQTRSADEPTTVFVTCLECGKNWRM
jgi:DNA-directed RNA polymerase subunit M/transcription elongation factor TFIIS